MSRDTHAADGWLVAAFVLVIALMASAVVYLFVRGDDLRTAAWLCAGMFVGTIFLNTAALRVAYGWARDSCALRMG